MKSLLFLAVGLTATLPANAALIAHYNGEEVSGPLTDQVGGQTAAAVDAGHVYGQPGPSGWGNAIGTNSNGSWQLDATESGELNALLNNYSVAAWVYQDSSITKTGANNGNNRIVGDDEAWNGNAWSFGIRDNQLLLTKNGVVDAFSSGGMTIPTDLWVHVAVTASSTGGLTFYLNGAVDGTNANAANNVAGSDLFGIGRSYGNGEGQYFAGNLDEVRVYDHVLSGAEVAALAIPEPGVGALVGLGVLGLAARRRRISA